LSSIAVASSREAPRSHAPEPRREPLDGPNPRLTAARRPSRFDASPGQAVAGRDLFWVTRPLDHDHPRREPDPGEGEGRALVERFPCPEGKRATNARLTDHGWMKIQDTAPRRVSFVREHVIDALTPDQIAQLTEITDAVLCRLDPDGALADAYRRHDRVSDSV
jgi:hypothetical protein